MKNGGGITEGILGTKKDLVGLKLGFAEMGRVGTAESGLITIDLASHFGASPPAPNRQH